MISPLKVFYKSFNVKETTFYVHNKIVLEMRIGHLVSFLSFHSWLSCHHLWKAKALSEVSTLASKGICLCKKDKSGLSPQVKKIPVDAKSDLSLPASTSKLLCSGGKACAGNVCVYCLNCNVHCF